MSSLLTDLSEKCELQAMDILALRKQVRGLEAENEKLKKLLAQYGLFSEVVGDPAHEFASLRRELHRVDRENIKLRALVADMWRDGMCECDERYTCDECEYGYHERMKELGIEVD